MHEVEGPRTGGLFWVVLRYVDLELLNSSLGWSCPKIGIHDAACWSMVAARKIQLHPRSPDPQERAKSRTTAIGTSSFENI